LRTRRRGHTKDEMIESHPQTEKIQLELLRRLGGPGRFALMQSFSRTLINMNRGAYLRLHPGATPEDAKIAFVANHYGQELARRFAARLRQIHDG